MAQHGDFWRAVETIHHLIYFAPDAKERYEALGLKGYWMGYFASRGAALGEPGPEVVTAAFHGFSPDIVRRAIPDAWARADRKDILAARHQLASDTLRPAVEASGIDVETIGDALQKGLAELDVSGKVLAGAHRSVPVPGDPIARLWHGATAFREYRGDCHVAVLTSAGLPGCAANVLQVATGRAEPVQQRLRGWSDEDWAAATESLREWGWVDESGQATDLGRTARERLEDATDRSCETPLPMHTRARLLTVTEPLLALARAVADSGVVEYPNPTGGRRP